MKQIDECVLFTQDWKLNFPRVKIYMIWGNYKTFELTLVRNHMWLYWKQISNNYFKKALNSEFIFIDLLPPMCFHDINKYTRSSISIYLYSYLYTIKEPA